MEAVKAPKGDQGHDKRACHMNFSSEQAFKACCMPSQECLKSVVTCEAMFYAFRDRVESLGSDLDFGSSGLGAT